MADQGRELGWNDPIQNDGSDFTLLEPGEYDFRVIGFERARHGGSAKLPPCNKAVVTLDVGDDLTSTSMKHNLFLHTKTEGLLCEFFRAIGARKHGEQLVMDWAKVVGATGRCRVKSRTWKGNDGEDRQSNDIDRFLDPTDDTGNTQAATPSAADDMPF